MQCLVAHSQPNNGPADKVADNVRMLRTAGECVHALQ